MKTLNTLTAKELQVVLGLIAAASLTNEHYFQDKVIHVPFEKDTVIETLIDDVLSTSYTTYLSGHEAPFVSPEDVQANAEQLIRSRTGINYVTFEDDVTQFENIIFNTLHDGVSKEVAKAMLLKTVNESITLTPEERLVQLHSQATLSKQDEFERLNLEENLG